jgi:hypothetical protein
MFSAACAISFSTAIQVTSELALTSASSHLINASASALLCKATEGCRVSQMMLNSSVLLGNRLRCGRTLTGLLPRW